VKLHFNGHSHLIEIDDSFAFDNIHRKLFGARSRNKNEFWVSLMEKAMMYLYGGKPIMEVQSNTSIEYFI